MKKILGIDLGTSSIGWAIVNEAEHANEVSTIEKIGVRVNPLTTDEQTNFEKGKPLTTNADRTLKRGARRNLHRYKLRRDQLIKVLKEVGLILDDTGLAENGKNTTHDTWKIRSKAATEKIEKSELVRVLLAINKKRGYKSSRKTKNEEEGSLIDGMAIAKHLYEQEMTPGEFSYKLLLEGRQSTAEFYRSDLQNEFDRVWEVQKQFYPDILTDDFYKELGGRGQKATATLFWVKYNFNTAENKGSKQDKKLQAYKWRTEALSKQLTKEEVAYVLSEINSSLANSSGYLGKISDRSKELYFNGETIGQYLYKQIKTNPHTRLKNQVFYRQDYLDEFEAIWETQRKYHIELSSDLKEKVRDIVIFYQRPLKSQKGLISFCEFESKEVIKNGKGVTIGLRVAPKSSPLFQEFKIWQILNNLKLKRKKLLSKSIDIEQKKELVVESDDTYVLDFDAKRALFEELNIKGRLSSNYIIKFFGLKANEWEINYSKLEGNNTNREFYEAFLKIIQLEGYDAKELLGITSNKEKLDLEDATVSALRVKEIISDIFSHLGIDTQLLNFNAELEGDAFEKQASYQFWHLLYSVVENAPNITEEDILRYGNENLNLKKQLCKKFGFKPEHAKIIARINLGNDYGEISTKAMRKMYPYIQEQGFSQAAEFAGYRHSKQSITTEENKQRKLKSRLDLIKKNSLRNPVVEKILNQMVNVVNCLIESENKKRKHGPEGSDFHFDEIRIELARELKKNASERAEMTKAINDANGRHEKIKEVLRNEFNISNPTRNDVIRYKLYEELKANGYKDLYTNKYIERHKIFSKEIDIEHIIPQSKMFDDSFSNKTLAFRDDNLTKGNKTAFDYIQDYHGEEKLKDYLGRIESLYQKGQNNEGGISKAKYKKLLMSESEIGEGFIERDLRDSQYIAKKAKSMLLEITRSVLSTSGAVTSRLREDWGLVNVMQELNLQKYKAQGLTELIQKKDGSLKERIVDWTKRNDHRHHAMDALTVAFTKHNHIQYLNYLNARKNEKHKKHKSILSIETLETELKVSNDGTKKRLFKKPIPNFRQEAKIHLEAVLISHKAKNKIVTKNKNRIKRKENVLEKIELTPRGQLHKEKVYGKYHFYQSKEEKVSAKFDEELIRKVANPQYRELLQLRLQEHNGDPKKAFSGKNAINKEPIYLGNGTETIPEKIKLTWLEEDYSIRKEVNPENFKTVKNVEKIIDSHARKTLLKRLEDYGGDSKKAFSDLENNPIWLNKEKGICIKRVKISGVKNAEALHFKKDHLGKPILDKNQNRIPSDYVSTGNNHHLAIYKDENENLVDKIVSFYEAVERVSQGMPIINKTLNSELGWEFLFSLKQNEMFVFPNEKEGFYPKELDLMSVENKSLISQNLYRVQKISRVQYGNSVVREYVFRHHLETTVEEIKELKNITYKNIKSLDYLREIVKVRINHTGQIVGIGEY